MGQLKCLVGKPESKSLEWHKSPLGCLCRRGNCHIHANSDISPICSDASSTNSNVSPSNSYSVPPVYLAHFCHASRYIPCFLPVTYLSPCCYLLLPCVYPFHVFPPLMCFSYSTFHMSCVYHKGPVLSVSI